MEQKQTVEEAASLIKKFVDEVINEFPEINLHYLHLAADRFIDKNLSGAASLPTNSVQWVRASELKELPKVKKYYNCKYHGMPTVLYIDGKNIVLDGTKLGKGIYDKIEILIESAPTEPTPDNSHK